MSKNDKSDQAIEMIQQQKKSMELIGGLRHLVPCYCNREWPMGERRFRFKELTRVYGPSALRVHHMSGLLQQRFRDIRITQNRQAVSTDVARPQLESQVGLLFAEI